MYSIPLVEVVAKMTIVCYKFYTSKFPEYIAPTARGTDTCNAEQRKTGYVAQFTLPLDSPNEIGSAATDIYTMVSGKHDKLTVTQQPAVFNYADRRFRHEQGSEPTPVHIPEHYTELVGYLELIRTTERK